MNHELPRIDEDTLKQCKLYRRFKEEYDKEHNRRREYFNKVLFWKIDKKHSYSEMWQKAFDDEVFKEFEKKVHLVHDKLVNKIESIYNASHFTSKNKKNAEIALENARK